jgi:hypothetical protein
LACVAVRMDWVVDMVMDGAMERIDFKREVMDDIT